MKLGDIGDCCGCKPTIKQAAVATSWWAWSGLPVAASDGTLANPGSTVPKYETLKWTANYAGDTINTLYGGPLSTVVTSRWCGPIGNVGVDWPVTADQLRAISLWAVSLPNGCGYLTIPPNTETEITYIFQNNDPDKQPICSYNDTFIRTLECLGPVDWRKPSLDFSYEKGMLDKINWDLIPDGFTGGWNLLGILTGCSSPPLMVNNDPFQTVAAAVGRDPNTDPNTYMQINPGLFSTDGINPSSALVMCGPLFPQSCWLYGVNGDEPHGMDPDEFIPTSCNRYCGVYGGEASPLYTGFVVRTRVEIGSVCVLTYDQVVFDCEQANLFGTTPTNCVPNSPGPIFLEPSSVGINYIAVTNPGAFTCCGSPP